MSNDILVVDDEKDIRLLIRGLLEDEGYSIREADGDKAAFQQIHTKRPDLIILDIWLQGGGRDGLEILDTVKREHPSIPVLMISGHGTIETAVNAIKTGAYDFIEKPFKADRLILMIQRALEAAQLKTENESLKAKIQTPDNFLGSSGNAATIQQTIDKVGPTNSRVLITGEPGTGKNVVGRALHKLSKRSNGPFVSVNCGALADDEFENVFFGSGDQEANQGVIEKAASGTLFVDEIGDMPDEMQKRFVRFLQDGVFKRQGQQKDIQADVRVIATSSGDLETAMKEGRFREDLFYRMNVVPIHIAPLRERPQDIPALIDFFIYQCAIQSDLKPCKLSEKTIATLQGCEWPGNARQLRNVIEWLLIMNNKGEGIIDPDQLPVNMTGNTDPAKTSVPKPANDYIGLSLKEAREEFERHYLISQLNRFGGNISQTAKFVGMERSALHRKMKSLDISTPDKQDEMEEESRTTQKA